MATRSKTVEFGGLDIICNSIAVGATKPGQAGTVLAGSELTVLDGVTPGTAAASKALVLNSSSGITTGLTLLTAATVTGTTAIGVTGTGAHISVRREIIADGAAVVLTEAQSGGLVYMDKTDGSLTTLPEITATNIGMTFDFAWPVSYVSGTQKIITGVAGDLIVGTILKFDTDTLTDPLSVESYNGTNHIAVVIDNVTDGGLLGSHLKLTAISATQWLIEGILHHSGSVSATVSTS